MTEDEDSCFSDAIASPAPNVQNITRLKGRAMKRVSSLLSISDVPAQTARVEMRPSPTELMYYKGTMIQTLIDTGAETNIIREDMAMAAGMKIEPTNQLATMASGTDDLKVAGEVDTKLHRQGHKYHFTALVAQLLDAPHPPPPC